MRTLSRGRPVHSAVLTAAALLLVVTTLSGCTANPAPAPSETAAPDAETTAAPTEAPPVFTSDDEALAAATAAYAAYTQGSNEFASSPRVGSSSELFRDLVTKSYLPEVEDSLDSFATSGHVGLGSISFDTVSLVSSSEPSPGHAEVSLYLCADVSDLRIIDEAGADVTAADRSERTPTQVLFISSDKDASKLLVDREDTWTGRNFCG